MTVNFHRVVAGKLVRNLRMSRKASGAAMALALLGGAQLALIGLPSDAAHAARAPKTDYTKEFVAPAQAANEALTANDLVKAREQLALAMPHVKTPDDKLFAGQVTFGIANKADDNPMRRQGIQMMLDSGKLAATDIGRFQYYLGSFAYAMDDFAAAETAFASAIASGYRQDDIEAVYAESKFQQNKFAEGFAIMQQAIETRRAAGTAAPETWLKRATGVAYTNDLGAEALEWGIKLVSAYPTADNWRSALTIARETQNNGSQENVDILRLMRRTNSLTSERDYGEYAEIVDARRLPGEVLAVLEEGVAKGVVKSNDVFFAEQLGLARGRINADRAELAGSERAANASASGVSALATGDALLGYGELARAQAMYELAISKGGIDEQRALTRIGIAMTDQGNYAGAKEVFGRITGTRANIARLWLAYIATKETPAG